MVGYLGPSLRKSLPCRDEIRDGSLLVAQWHLANWSQILLTRSWESFIRETIAFSPPSRPWGLTSLIKCEMTLEKKKKKKKTHKLTLEFLFIFHGCSYLSSCYKYLVPGISNKARWNLPCIVGKKLAPRRTILWENAFQWEKNCACWMMWQWEYTLFHIEKRFAMIWRSSALLVIRLWYSFLSWLIS